MLGEKIKAFRKQLKMTQEQLADTMNVTVGAVSKWELGLSNPDITLLPKLAKQFGVSLDVLFEFQLTDESANDYAKSIRNYRYDKQYDKGAEIATEAIRRYPNNFDIIYQSATMFMLQGIERRDSKALEKALDLYKQSCPLIGQNRDQSISELSIQINIGETLLYLGKTKEALDHLKKYNYCGINNTKIGLLLIQENKIDDAFPYLSESLLNIVGEAMSCCVAFTNAYVEKKQYQNAYDFLHMVYELTNHLRKDNQVSYIDKMQAILLVGMAEAHISNQRFTEANSCLLKAYELAKIFDVSPDYNAQNIKFYQGDKQIFGDDAGETAMASVERIISMYENNADYLKNAWNNIINSK